ncbi:MAG: hypothetical protein KME26_34005 [Oscillatoria princeps RMCB-10]|jgi:hypothetical protein|nr:hypothetical protein [Oscillatoria princeps RMCB-10]
MQSKTLKILLWLIGLSAAIAALAIVVANLLAIEPEKEIEQAKAVFLRKYPKTEDSASAVKLHELSSRIGYKLIVSAKDKDKINVSDADGKAFREIQADLSKYITAQVERPTDEIDVPPEKLRRYLKSKELVLAAIRTHLLNSEVPRWATDTSLIEKADIDQPLVSYLDAVNIKNLQQLLALDILEKNRLGQTKPMLESLEVSWKLNQSLRNTIIPRGNSVITASIHAGVMRKLNGLPPEWQQRLLEHDYRKSTLTYLEGGVFFSYQFLKNANLRQIYFYYSPTTEYRENKFFILLRPLIWLGPLGNTYWRLAAIDTAKVGREMSAKLSGENVCSFEMDSTSEKLAWWNLFGKLAIPDFAYEWRKPGRLMLELEMTQKILQAKELAAKQGKWPQSLPGLESSVCAGYTWIYKVSPDGTMSISLSQTPEWFNHTTEVPLTYSAIADFNRVR